MNARAFPLIALALFGAACTARAPRPEPLPDCAAAEAYEFKIWVDDTNEKIDDTFERDAGTFEWFETGDCTPGGESTLRVETIPNGRCGSQGALVFRSEGFQDWGSVFGVYGWVTKEPDERDGSEFDGLSFWARAPGRSDKGINLGISDRQSSASGGLCREGDGGTPSSVCASEGGTPMSEPNTDAGLPPAPGSCGNNWTQQLVLTEFWKLYLLPWETFAQDPVPNRVEAIDPKAIFSFSINLPKDSRIELWIDDIGFYRRK